MASSPPLQQFLNDIGAASLSPDITLPAPGQAPPFAALQQRVEREINAIDEEILALLSSEWETFSLHVTGGRELVDRIEMEEEELDELDEMMVGDRAFIPALLTALQAHSSLQHAHSDSSHSVLALQSLTKYASSIEALAANTTAGALPSSVISLDTILSLPPPPLWVSQLPAWVSLSRWASDEQARLEGAVVGALERCFEFSAGGSGSEEPARLVLRKEVEAAPEGEKLGVQSLLQVLEEVFRRGKAGKKVDTQLARIAKQLLKTFLVPFVEDLGQSTAPTRSFAYTEGPEESEVSITLQPSTTNPPAPTQNGHTKTSPPNPYSALETFLTFFAQHSSLLPPCPYAPTFTLHLTPPLQQLLLSAHLLPTLPSTIALLPPYLNTLSAAAEFEEDFLCLHGYLSFLPAGEEVTRDEGRVVRDWIANVERHWARKVGDEALEKVREEIRNCDWESEMVDVSVEVELPPPPPTPKIVTPVPPSAPKFAPVQPHLPAMKKPILSQKSTSAPKQGTPPRAPPTPPPEAPVARAPARTGKLGTRIAKTAPPPTVSAPSLPPPVVVTSEVRPPSPIVFQSSGLPEHPQNQPPPLVVIPPTPIAPLLRDVLSSSVVGSLPPTFELPASPPPVEKEKETSPALASEDVTPSDAAKSPPASSPPVAEDAASIEAATLPSEHKLLVEFPTPPEAEVKDDSEIEATSEVGTEPQADNAEPQVENAEPQAGYAEPQAEPHTHEEGPQTELEVAPLPEIEAGSAVAIEAKPEVEAKGEVASSPQPTAASLPPPIAATEEMFICSTSTSPTPAVDSPLPAVATIQPVPSPPVVPQPPVFASPPPNVASMVSPPVLSRQISTSPPPALRQAMASTPPRPLQPRGFPTPPPPPGRQPMPSPPISRPSPPISRQGGHASPQRPQGGNASPQRPFPPFPPPPPNRQNMVSPPPTGGPPRQFMTPPPGQPSSNNTSLRGFPTPPGHNQQPPRGLPNPPGQYGRQNMVSPPPNGGPPRQFMTSPPPPPGRSSMISPPP
ncbi:hypothetical protein P7C70_g5369, partial [Phenoliferia sp. Uapishka_3]